MCLVNDRTPRREVMRMNAMPHVPAHRSAIHCPLCSTRMEELEGPQAIWTTAELCTDLARMTDEIADEGTALLWYSRCPKGCHQCFGCRAWLRPGERCRFCPPCEECGGPMVLMAEEVEIEEEAGESNMHFECVRCLDDNDDEADGKLN